MSPADKISELRGKVVSALAPLVDSDYALLDCPYHFNIGDTLIWRGEQSFLSQLPYKCLNQSSMYTFHDGIDIPDSAVILLHGGGNFGDLWDGHQQFRRRIVEKYPGNRIVILPQTVHYENAGRMKSDAEAFSRHPDLTICARDASSYEILRSNFSNPALLVPDPAFCILLSELQKYEAGQRKGILFIKRNDRESTAADGASVPCENVDVRDWPASNRRSFIGLIMRMLRGASILLGRHCGNSGAFRLACRLTDNFAHRYLIPHSVKAGVRFVSPYAEVFTSRLHGGILAFMLGRKCTLLDNSYGKNGDFYETWLADADGIGFMKP